ncbi:MAG: hypothetical protein ABIJ57_07915 [Pseudomonadota bacterium]|nr:hypothetical protein [Pseudomonadota bacterium]
MKLGFIGFGGAGFGLRERFGGELPATLQEVLQAMEAPPSEKSALKEM